MIEIPPEPQALGPYREGGRNYISLALPPWRSGLFRPPPKFQTCARSVWWTHSAEAQADRSSVHVPSSLLAPAGLILSTPGTENRWRVGSWNASATACVFQTEVPW